MGPCIYALAPPSQIVEYGGASVSIAVTTQEACAWTAASDSSWLSLTQPAGIGSGGNYCSRGFKYNRSRTNSLCDDRHHRCSRDSTSDRLHVLGHSVIAKFVSSRGKWDAGRLNYLSYFVFQQCNMDQSDNTFSYISRVHGGCEHEFTIPFRNSSGGHSGGARRVEAAGPTTVAPNFTVVGAPLL